MSLCGSCNANVPDDSRFCPSCGAEQSVQASAVDLTMTQAGTAAPASSSPPASLSTSSVTTDNSRFVPGTMVADRYRIVGLLGRGGMGEVYRADDLKLGQPVALKFLPENLEHDADRLGRFLNEVRTARQVTHSNVCRVYDIDDVDGRHFLSMEYVDGEDMASLLRRVGRLPEERAVEVARQICAGLAAAHEQGVLHRDLKPANVMIDGRGRVRLTDFGLAGMVGGIDGDEIRNGTPAYMSPEQLKGEEVTPRSDIYSLGLVLYELFTGKKTFKADTVDELQKLHTSAAPSSLTTHVDGLDPAVEAAVMRCLEKRAADRPTSAHAVAAALPGGDPLAAALAAGETPSPELVAEAGTREGMRPGAAFGLALAALLLVLGVANWAGRMSVPNHLPLEKRPEVLMDRAQGMLDELGFDAPVYTQPADRAWGMVIWNSILDEVEQADSTATRWQALRDRPDAGSFWYRQSPRVLAPNPVNTPIFIRGSVTLTNPSPSTAGEVGIMLDLAGRLRRLEVMPKRFSTREPEEPDWMQLFALAGLDPTRFEEARPRYQRFMAPDLRRAWLGTRIEDPDTELRIEAGAFEGQPVLFNLTTEASLQSLSEDPKPLIPSLGARIGDSLQSLLILTVVLFSLRLSMRNLKRTSIDRRGATRFAVLAATLYVLGNALGSHVLFTYRGADEIWPLLVGGVFIAGISWSLYAAAEPLGRRVWPTMFVSSSRLLSRDRTQWRDPLIGKSVLVGVLAGVAAFAVQGPLRFFLPGLVTGVPARLLGVNPVLLQGQRQALGVAVDQALVLGLSFILVMALIVIQKLVKRRWLTFPLTLIVWTFINGGGGNPASLVFSGGFAVVMMVVLLRWGVVSMVTAYLTTSLLWSGRSADWSAWWGQGALISMVVLGLLVVYGGWAAMGGGRSRPASS